MVQPHPTNNLTYYFIKTQYNQISTAWTLKWWESEPNNYDKNYIIRLLWVIFRTLEDFYLFHALSVSMADIVFQITSYYTPKKTQYNQISTLWDKGLDVQGLDEQGLESTVDLEMIRN